jgi:tetratricopeptide (TPR) repeat protein
MLNDEVNPKGLSRLELLKLAQALRVSDADVMTRAELQAAIERAKKPEPRPQPQSVTWLGVARRLLASIVEQGLHLPDAAALIRGDGSLRPTPSGPPPVATVTLARIYAAQGHLERAIGTLDEVLASDPDHDLARDLRAQLAVRLEERQRQEALLAKAAGSSPTSVAAKPANGGAAKPSNGGAARTGAAKPANGAAKASARAAVAKAAVTSAASADSETTEVGLKTEPSVSISPAPAPAQADAIDASAPSTDPVELGDSGGVSALGPPTDAIDATERPTEIPGSVELATPVASADSVEPAARVEAAFLTLADSAGTTAVVDAPRANGLVLIETGAAGLYLYWELGPSAAAEGSAEPHWVWVVSHAPHREGSRRRERRFPVHHSSGAVHLEGMAAHAVVRAKLTRSDVAEAPALAVAGLVWAAEPAQLANAEARFLPYPAADPGSLAARAGASLANAGPFLL